MEYNLQKSNQISFTEKREKTYVRFSLFFCVLAVIVYFHISKQSLGWEMNKPFLWLIAISALPVSIFMEILVGWFNGAPPKKFFVKNPKETTSCEIGKDMKIIVSEIVAKIKGEGFQTKVLETEDSKQGVEIHYSKEKKCPQ